jgi:hypothetical protein
MPDPIETGLRAWVDGDLDTLERLLDPDVRLEWAEASGLDCVGREQVMRALHQARGDAQQSPQPRRIERLGDDVVVVSPTTTGGIHNDQSAVTRITVKAGRITRLQQFSSREAAVSGPNPVEDAAVQAVRAGDIPILQQLLADNPLLASARLTHHGDRTLLHVATDWPGHYPNVGTTIRVLVAAGADADAPSIGDHTETPLHWAASSDDVEALDALLAAGANIEAEGAVIGGGTPLSDATAFGQWKTAQRLVERGAHAQMWEAAALGLLPPLQQYLAAEPTRDDITHSFWCACHGNQLETAAVLLTHGADINWIGYDGLTPLDAAERSGGTKLLNWLTARGAQTAGSDPQVAAE